SVVAESSKNSEHQHRSEPPRPRRGAPGVACREGDALDPPLRSRIPMSAKSRPSPASDRASPIASRRAAAVALIEVSRGRRLTIMAALGVGTFVTALSNSVLNAILPLIATSFETDISAVEWIVTTFLVVQS